ncbi:PfkB family carbohydrate kinase [Gracilibacillus sp. D59]
MGILVVGSFMMDLVVRTYRAPEEGETIIGDSFARFPGGKGANQAVAAA